MNSPLPYVASNVEKNEFPRTVGDPRATPSNGNEHAKFYHNNENFYTNQRDEKFEPKYGYDEKNFYSNVQQHQPGSGPAPQISHEDRSSRATRNAVYSNVEPPVPIPVPATVTKGKDLIYSNIQWNPKPENTYSNIPASHNNGKNCDSNFFKPINLFKGRVFICLKHKNYQ